MSSPSWLATLQQATTYQQLQEAFDQMSAAVMGQAVDPLLVDSIDQAIERIEQERARDEAELAQFNQQYASFKGENAGVIGWFKRKMPFTATRKQDVELRDSVRDQEAEILADNFVIARAQMLKESLLPPEQARTGKPSSIHRQQLSLHDSIVGLREYGHVLLELHGEAAPAEAFLTEIKNDIDAFAAARFVEKEDQQLQKSGLDRARSELGKLSEAVADKRKLASAAEDRLRQLIEQELAGSDPSFLTLQQHLGQLTEFVQQCDSLKPALDARRQALGKIKQKLHELSDLPAKAKAIAGKLDKSLHDLQTAQTALQVATTEYEPLRQRYEAAREAAEQAKLRVEATRPLVHAYLAQQGLDADSPASAASSSPLCAEYESLQAAAATGQQQLSAISAQHDTAQRTVQQRQAEVDKLIKTGNDIRAEQAKLHQEKLALESDVSAQCDQYRLAKLTFQSAIQTWMTKRSQLQWHSNFSIQQLLPLELSEDLFGPQMNSMVQTQRDCPAITRIADAFARFADQFQQSTVAAKSSVQSLTSDRRNALLRRASLLLAPELASRLFV